MTYREIELFIEGQDEARTWFLESLAWMQANLINVHVPRGKPRVRADQLLPKRRKKKANDDEATRTELAEKLAPLSAATTSEGPRARLEAVKARARATQEAREWNEFRNSAEGKRIAALLDDDSEE